MLTEARKLPPEGRTAREVYRHVGDFTLFWTGVFPESLERARAGPARTRSSITALRASARYFIASQFAEEPYQEEAPLLRRLSEQFELCAMASRRCARSGAAGPRGELSHAVRDASQKRVALHVHSHSTSSK